jgi:excisionase family DNA binding protein
MSQSIFLTVAECAQALQCSPATIKRLLKKGELRGIKIGRLVRIPASELERLAAGEGER